MDTEAAMGASPLTWTPATLIDPGSVEPPQLDGVSCPSHSLCVAVDSYGNVVSSTDPATPASWRVSRPYVTRTGLAGLAAVSCASIDFCLAGGGNTFLSSTEPTGGAGGWSSHGFDEGVSSSLSCPTKELCIGVGSSGNIWSSTEPSGNRIAWKKVNVGDHSLHSVSCPSTSLCVAVDSEGDVLTSSEPTGPSGAWNVTVVDPGNAILGVSCVSASLCVAVDQAGDVLSSTEPSGSSGAWTISEVKKGVPISAISCFSESLCVAVDESGDVLSSIEPAGGAGTWEATHVDEHALEAVSCGSASLCVATDDYGDVLSATEPTGDAAAWSAAQVDTMTSPPLATVSCASPSLCVASGYGKLLTSTEPTAGVAGWKLESEGLGAAGLGLSCPSASLCVSAAESQVSASTEPMGGAGTWVEETGWFDSPGLQPEAEYFGPSGSVSCPSENFCAADGDSFNDFDTLVVSTDPIGGASQWYEVNADTGGGNEVTPPHYSDVTLGVSCASMALCVAVDAAGNVLSSTDPASSKSTWTVTPVDTRPLHGVSCPSVSLCVAVDDAGNIVWSTNPAGGSTAWTVSNVDSSHNLTAITCAATSLCVAVDDAGNVLVSTDPVGGPATWSATDLDSTPSTSRALTAVTCVPPGLCVAVDNAGYALTAALVPSRNSGEGEEPITLLPPLAKANDFKILKARTRKNGRIVLTLDSTSAGSFTGVATTTSKLKGSTGRNRIRRYSGKGKPRRRRDAYGAGAATVSGPGTTRLTIKPRRAALNALRRIGRLPVRIAVTYTPNGGTPKTMSKAVTVSGSVAHHPD